MQAFLNDTKIQTKFIGRVKAHALADEIVQGKYWEDGKGCAVGCTIHGNEHSKYETQLGIPQELAHLQDAIFEMLPAAEAKKFPLQFLEAIPLGADLSRVWDKFHVWLLLDERDGLIAIPDMKSDCVGWIKTIAVLYQRSASGASPSGQEQDEAQQAARAARAAWDAWDARDARAAWDAWDARAAWDAWDARAAWDAWDARDARDAWDARDARAARDAWDARDARAARIQRQRDQLLKLLREAA